ncbi:MAG: hypothetical protein II926_01495 [Bacteroidales bacterium]|nr:hypothetical protein [Bacteroidales bacterium]
MKKVILFFVAAILSVTVFAGNDPQITSTPDAGCNSNSTLAVKLSCQVYSTYDLKTPITNALRENQFKLVMESKAQYLVEFCYTPVPKAKFGGASYDIKNFTATVSNVETGESVLTISIKDVKKEAEVTDALVKAMKSVFSK